MRTLGRARMCQDEPKSKPTPAPRGGDGSPFKGLAAWMRRRSAASLRMSAQLRGYGLAAVVSYGKRWRFCVGSRVPVLRPSFC